MNPQQLLQWYLDAGVDEAVDDTAVNRFAQVTPQAKVSATSARRVEPVVAEPPATPKRTVSKAPHMSPHAAATFARSLADGCTTREELEQAVRNFEGCDLKRTATNTVFCDGSPNAKIMFIGEAPGASEDVQGIPFCGASGQLLDKMLGFIGLTRENFYITNTVFWRPPGNRQPTRDELTICQPFVEKHIALINPALLVLVGGTAATAVLNKETSLTKLRGRLYDYTNPYLQKTIPVAVTYHPSYLLRQPAAKALAWQDLLFICKTLHNDLKVEGL